MVTVLNSVANMMHEAKLVQKGEWQLPIYVVGVKDKLQGGPSPGTFVCQKEVT